MKLSPALRIFYATMYATMEPEEVPGSWGTARAIAAMMADGQRRPVYERIASHPDVKPVPWYVVGCLHTREAWSDFEGPYFRANIANGQSWREVTTIVPKGRGPFESFEQAAIDAILYELKKKPGLGSLAFNCIEDHAYFFETWNGFGHLLFRHDCPSHYLWGRTSHQRRGGYPSDGKWNPAYVNKSMGCMLILRALAAGGYVAPVALSPSRITPPEFPAISVDAGGFEISRFQAWMNLLARLPGQPLLKTDGGAGPKTQLRYQQVFGSPMKGAPDRSHELSLIERF